MNASSTLRVIAIAIVVFIAWKFLGPSLGFGGKAESAQNIPPETYLDAPGFAPDVVDAPAPGQPAPQAPPEGKLCNIKGPRFDAILSTRGAAIVHFYLRDPQYAGTDGLDLSTTDLERWRSLRTLFRGEGGSDQLKFDRFDWQLDSADGKTCSFSYADDKVRIEKKVSATGRPFELDVTTTLTNVDSAPHRHRFSIEAFAYRQNKEVKGKLGRVSPFVTQLACARTDVSQASSGAFSWSSIKKALGGSDDVMLRKPKDDFKDGWFSAPLVDRFVAVSNYYFAQALVPVSSPEAMKPACNVLAEDWYTYGQKRDDDEAGAVYHGRLEYPPAELAPQKRATYEQIAFFGPKERDVLASAGTPGAHLGDVIDLGFFSPVAKVLVGVLVFFHAHVTMGNWGIAIILMTICLRVLLFPLSLKQIRTSIAMRRLKPQMDAIAAKFKDDMQAKNMATMELYRKEGVNPLAGCLPQLVAMPVWFAMYTTLQTAVEMYHERFLWFRDLSAPDAIFVLPAVLGACMIAQSHIMPQQGMDPVQAKMMKWMLPGVFTVMMLFLPAALGLYMLTSSIIGIVQQLIIERIAPRNGPPARGGITVRPGKSDKASGEDDKRRVALAAPSGKGYAGV